MTKNQVKETVGWYITKPQAKYCHYVETQKGELLGSAICGVCLKEKQDWLPTTGQLECADCQEALERRARDILEMTKGLIPVKKEARERVDVPEEAKQHAHFLQVVGPEIPLCWIPVPDVQAVVKLLLEHLPDSILRLKRAQFQSVITTLNEYVGEALERNAEKTTTYVATWSDANEAGPEKKGKKK